MNILIAVLVVIGIGSTVYLLLLNKKKKTHANGLETNDLNTVMQGGTVDSQSPQVPNPPQETTTNSPIMNDVFAKNSQNTTEVDEKIADSFVVAPESPVTPAAHAFEAPTFDQTKSPESKSQNDPSFSEESKVSSMASINEPVQLEEVPREPMIIDTEPTDTATIDASEAQKPGITEIPSSSLFSSVAETEDALGKIENEKIKSEEPEEVTPKFSDLKAEPSDDLVVPASESNSSFESNSDSHLAEPSNTSLEDTPSHDLKIVEKEIVEPQDHVMKPENKLGDIQREIAHGSQNKDQIKSDLPEPPEQEI